jgi:hypothetical protein
MKAGVAGCPRGPGLSPPCPWWRPSVFGPIAVASRDPVEQDEATATRIAARRHPQADPGTK